MDKHRRENYRHKIYHAIQIINEIANVPNKEILKLADTKTKCKHRQQIYIMSNNTNQ